MTKTRIQADVCCGAVSLFGVETTANAANIFISVVVLIFDTELTHKLWNIVHISFNGFAFIWIRLFH